MTQWEALAQSLTFPGEKEMWEELYGTRKLSINQLSTKFACSPHTVRTRLNSCAIPIRKRGGPNSLKVIVNEDLMSKIRAHGVPKAAKILGVSPQTLYNRLYYSLGLKKRDLEKIRSEVESASAEDGDAALKSPESQPDLPEEP